MIGNGHAGFGRAASEKDPQGHLAGVVPRQAAIPARLRGNGHGNGFAKRCAHGERATALRRPRTTGRARTHAGVAPLPLAVVHACATSRRTSAGGHIDRATSPIASSTRSRLQHLWIAPDWQAGVVPRRPAIPRYREAGVGSGCWRRWGSGSIDMTACRRPTSWSRGTGTTDGEGEALRRLEAGEWPPASVVTRLFEPGRTPRLPHGRNKRNHARA